MQKKIFFLASLVFVLSKAFSQSPSCGFDFARKLIPDYKYKEDKLNNKIYQDVLNGNTNRSMGGTIYIPIVFHIIHYNGPENVSDSVIHGMLDQLNLRFQNAAPYYDASGYNMNIQFCLASIDPQGNTTTGITRTYSTLTYLNGSNDIQMKDLNRWDPYYYYNVWIVNSIYGFNISVAGYSSLPSNLGEPIDGVVMDHYSINSSVLTHETGHYLGLYHTWQDGCYNNNCLLDGDHVCDTPPDTSYSTSVCMGNSCSTDMNDTLGNSPFIADVNELPNYMDYTACPLSFSQGQGDRMTYSIINIRSLLLQSAGCGFTGGTPPAAVLNYTISPCNDGVVHFADSLSTDVTTVNWDFNNDGSYDSYSHNPTYTYPATGTYTVKLKVVGTAGVDSIFQTIFVQKGTGTFYPIILNGGIFQNLHSQWASCGNFTNNFTAPAHAQSYLWSTGDTTQSISFIPDSTYTLTLTIVDSLGLTWTNSVCHPLTVIVHHLPPTAYIYTNDPLTICDGDQVTFHCTIDTTDSYTYTWYENGGAGTGNHDSVFTATGYFPGVQYQVVVADTNYCYSWSNVLYVYSYNPPAMQTITQNGTQLTSGWGGGNQWYKDGVAIPGATGMVYTITQNGCYQDEWYFSWAPACTTMSDSICFTSVGINNLDLINEIISIYPVPSSEIITLTVSAGLLNKEYEIRDVLGRIMLSGKIKSEKTSIEIKELAKGIYFLNIGVDEKKIIRKIVKE